MPFEWRHPIWYLAGLSIQSIVIPYVCMTCMCCVPFTIGACRIMIALADDIKIMINHLNKRQYSKIQMFRVNKKLCELIEFQVIAQQLSLISHDEFLQNSLKVIYFQMR